MQANRPLDLVRTTFQLLALGALILSSFWIVRPFLVATAWAATIAVATWPLLIHVQGWLGGRRGAAVAVMTVVLLLVLLVPFYFGVSAIVENAKLLVHWSKSLTAIAIPEPPAWVASVPVVGTKIASTWHHAAANPGEISAQLAPVARQLVFGFVGQVGSLGLLFVQFLLTVIVVAILYANGETAAHGVDRFARRLAGPRGEEAMHLGARAIRAVALGVIVTALVQTAAVGLGLHVAGVPFATILTVIVFIFAVAQVGPALVLIPSIIWVYMRSGAVWGTGFLVWGIFCLTFDNLLRPVLIRRGADLPLLLIFAGVIGGLIAFGIIGLFIGPVVLAVTYTLLAEWVTEDERRESEASPSVGSGR
jgi:predicted PurR-regulated permease PerM